MISKMKPVELGGSRIAIVFNGSPLYGCGRLGRVRDPSVDHRERLARGRRCSAGPALLNTGISTYFWIVTNRKSEERRGKVQLIDAREDFEKVKKTLGEKRKQISDAQIAEVTRLYAGFTEGERVKILSNEAFGYMRITVERPLRAEWRPAEFPVLLANPAAEQWMKDREDSSSRRW